MHVSMHVVSLPEVSVIAYTQQLLIGAWATRTIHTVHQRARHKRFAAPAAAAPQMQADAAVVLPSAHQASHYTSLNIAGSTIDEVV